MQCLVISPKASRVTYGETAEAVGTIIGALKNSVALHEYEPNDKQASTEIKLDIQTAILRLMENRIIPASPGAASDWYTVEVEADSVDATALYIKVVVRGNFANTEELTTIVYGTLLRVNGVLRSLDLNNNHRS